MRVASIAAGLGALLAAQACAQEAPEWVARIRPDHPRVFLNADTLPEVRALAQGPLAEHFAAVKAKVDEREGELSAEGDWGAHAMCAALVWRVTGDEHYLERARYMLDRSLEHYHGRVAEGRSVNWYSNTRIMALAAFDWIFDAEPEEWRVAWGRSMLDHLADVLPGGVPNLGVPEVSPVNRSGITTGFYGTPSLMWYAGLAMVGEGIDAERALDYLVRGHDLYIQLLEHRRAAAGDDGGAASATLGYALGAYPWAEFNFFHTWESATGENLAEQWPYVALFANYIMWNYLPGGREFGYGDAGHTTNKLPAGQMPLHIAQMMHFYCEAHPEWVALMRHMREQMFPGGYPTLTWGCHPLLLTRMDLAPPPMDPGELPHARHFEGMGQVFMRSGSGAEGTYALFNAGGVLRQHRHFDNLDFWIYHRGFLTVDSGTRANEDAGEHLQNYYAQTVAHNCVLIDMPDEPVSPYWNGPVHVQEGGQYIANASALVAFETNDLFSYVAGDATAAYRPEKCELCTRQMVFVYPNHFVIFDRVRSTQPEYRKRWLVHTAREPRIDGATIVADHEEGRMFCRTLLPADAVLTAIGGEGRRFMAGGRNWELPPGVEFTEMMGWGRVEVSAPEPAQEQVFLHLIEVGDQTRQAMSAAERISGEGSEGVRFDQTAQRSAGDGTVEVSFATTGDLAGHIRVVRGDEVLVDADLAREVQPQEGLASTGGQ